MEGRVFLNKRIVIVSVILIVIFLAGCNNDNIVSEKDMLTIDEEIIDIKIINKSELESGMYYTLEVNNVGRKMIKHVDIDLGFDIKEGISAEGAMGPIMFPAIPNDTTLNIKTGEKRTVRVYIPIGLVNSDKLDMDDIQINVEGYVSEMKVENRFQIRGSIEYFNQ